MRLGQKLRYRYQDFVSTRYVDNEVSHILRLYNFYFWIYVRSTDVNRTLMSAVANMVGFYPRNSGVADEDYPDVVGWPTGFTFVPIHTVMEGADPVVSFRNIFKNSNLQILSLVSMNVRSKRRFLVC